MFLAIQRGNFALTTLTRTGISEPLLRLTDERVR